MIPDAYSPHRPLRRRAPGGAILSRSQFFQTYGSKFGKPGSGAYTGYVNFRTNKPKERAAARAAAAAGAGPGVPGGVPGGGGGSFDPLAILTDAQLRARATAAVHAATAPVVNQLNTTFSNRGEEQAAQLAALTKMAVEAAGKYGPEVGAAYGGAKSDQASTDAALAALLHGGGVQAAGELASKLGTDSPIAAGAGAIGTGAAGANLATGSADLTRLISQGAAAQEYGAKLPGIAAGRGLENARLAQSQLDRDLADAIGKVTASTPGDVESLYQALESNRTSVALAQRSGFLDATTSAAKAAQPDASLSRTYGYVVDSNGNAITGADGRRVPVAKTGTGKNPHAPNAGLSRIYGYVVDSSGAPVLQNGQRVPVATKPGKPASNATAIKNRGTAVASARKEAFNLAQTSRGKPAKNPNPGAYSRKGNYVAKPGQSEFHDGTTNEPGRAVYEGRKSYSEAFNTIWARIHDTLSARYAIPDKAIRKLVNDQLVAAGYTLPSNRPG